MRWNESFLVKRAIVFNEFSRAEIFKLLSWSSVACDCTFGSKTMVWQLLVNSWWILGSFLYRISDPFCFSFIWWINVRHFVSFWLEFSTWFDSLSHYDAREIWMVENHWVKLELSPSDLVSASFSHCWPFELKNSFSNQNISIQRDGFIPNFLTKLQNQF